ncbi:MAG TPA: sulfatase [Myxococcota bacterium]|jgi:arylsulfatase A-like enzyme
MILVFVFGLVGVDSAAGAEPRPNVVFILADDLGWNDVGCYGSTFHETPNIDALAKRGMRFTQAYAASSQCSPTRASILTGLYPARIGITTPACDLPEVVLEKGLESRSRPDQKMVAANKVTRLKREYYTLAEAFKDAGYVTGHFGKWHLGREPYSPLQQGFDVDVPHTPAQSPLPNGYFYPFPVWNGHGKPGDNLEDLVSDEAARFIQENKARPFFLNYWAFDVHSPWQARKELIEKYRAKARPGSLQRNPVYAGMVETLDDAVGRVVGALKDAGVLEKTVIVFTSDNGPFFVPSQRNMPSEFTQVPVTSAYPLRAGKGTIYEGGVRVPLVIAWPGVTRPGSQSDALVQSVDFFPTIAKRLDLKLPTGLEFDGISFAGVLEGRGSARDEVFSHFPHVRGSRKYEKMPAPTPAAPASALRKGDWKLVRFYGDGPDRTNRHELFNLKDDPGETRDLAAARPEMVRELSARLDHYLQAAGAVIPRKNPNYVPSASLPPGQAPMAGRDRR